MFISQHFNPNFITRTMKNSIPIGESFEDTICLGFQYKISKINKTYMRKRL